jgi:hypothetical protein
MMGIATGATNLGSVFVKLGEFDAANTLFSEALALTEQLGLERASAYVRINLGDAASIQGDHLRAVDHYSAALRGFQACADAPDMVVAIGFLAEELGALGQHRAGVRLRAAALTLRNGVGSSPNTSQQSDDERITALIRGSLSADAFERAWAEGAALSLEAATSEALGIPDRLTIPEPPTPMHDR